MESMKDFLTLTLVIIGTAAVGAVLLYEIRRIIDGWIQEQTSEKIKSLEYNDTVMQEDMKLLRYDLMKLEQRYKENFFDKPKAE